MDCVIASIPFTDTVAPLMAPAVLKAQCNSHGFTAVTLDLNAELRSQILASSLDRNHLLRFYKQGQLHPDIADRVEQQIRFMSRRILAYSPRWVALSLFTYDCQWWRDHAHYRSIIQVNAGTPPGH